MLRLTPMVLMVLLLPACSSAAPDSEETRDGMPRISIEGNRFVREDGSTMIFRGLAFSDPDRMENAGRWGPAHFQEAADWGANVVRFPVHPDAWRRRGKAAYMGLLDAGIRWASDHNMYVIIDWHSIGNLRTERFQSANYNTTFEETRAFWTAVAERYKGRSEVVLYELFNEPSTGGGSWGELTWDQHRQMMETLIDAVRAIDPESLFLVGGLDWAYSLTEVVDNPVQRSSVAYVTHPYPQKRSAPWEAQWQRDWGFVADTYPVSATEFGFMSQDGPGAHIPVIGDEVYGQAIVAFFEERGISWTPWVFDPSWSPQLFSDWDYTPTRQGVFFKSKLLELNR